MFFNILIAVGTTVNEYRHKHSKNYYKGKGKYVINVSVASFSLLHPFPPYHIPHTAALYCQQKSHNVQNIGHQ